MEELDDMNVGAKLYVILADLIALGIPYLQELN